MHDDEIVRWFGFFAALHDLGKWSSAFQGLVEPVADALGHQGPYPSYSVKHDSLGWAIWRQHIRTAMAQPEGIDFERRHDVWMRCATGHHGQPPSLGADARLVRFRQFFNVEDVEAAELWTTQVLYIFNPNLNLGTEENFERASWWIAGLMTVADWLGSNVAWFPYRRTPMELDTYWEATQQRAQRAVYESGLGYVPYHRQEFQELFPSYIPTPVQNAVDQFPDAGPELLIIEDMTGSGKTEAAIVAAGNHFYFGLPTMATANGLWARVAAADTLQGQRTLAHGSRWLVPEAMTRATAWLNDSTRRALLSQIGVGTIDQAVLAVLYAKHATLRLVGLADKTTIIDEVHAYDDYQRALLKILIEMQARIGGSVVLLSATLPQGHRQGYVDAWARGRSVQIKSLAAMDYPLITRVNDGGIKERPVAASQDRTVEVDAVSDIESVIQRVISAAQSGFCVCWIRNTVTDAIEAWQALIAKGVEPELFHARFTVGDRQLIEERVLKRFGKRSTANERHGQVLVATQVVEQSLDLDFDVMISDIAPMDLLIQRAGRLHRHGWGDRGTPSLILHGPVFTNAPGENWIAGWGRGTSFVYPDHGRLWLTMKLLRKQGGFRLPRDARSLLEGIYGEETENDIPEGLRAVTIAEQGRGRKRAAQAGYHAIKTSGSYEAEGTPRWQEEQAPTRLGEPVQEWILLLDGAPLNGSVQRSMVRVRTSLIKSANTVEFRDKAPWQKTINLTREAGTLVAEGVNQRDEAVTVVYDQRVGLRLARGPNK